MKHFTTHLHPRPLLAALLLALLNCLPAAADYFTVGGLRFYFSSTSNTCTLASPSSGKYMGNITIPSEVTYYDGNTYSVTGIGEFAFSGCSGLTSVNIPNSVTSIGGYAFRGCSGLTSVNIPNSVTSIGRLAFYDCTSLTSINVDTNNKTYSSINGILYSKDKKTLITIPNAIVSVSIPNSVTSIGDEAFYGCSRLTSVSIPNSVTSIGYGAFGFCSCLTSITIPNSVTYIGGSAFCNCSGLKSVTIPNSVTFIGGDAFYRCTSLTSVTIPNSVASIVSSTFNGCTNLRSVTIPNSVTNIGADAFYNCSSLTSVTIPKSVASIGDDAFYNCTGLTSIYSLATAPPTATAGNETFYSWLYSNVTLYVPKGSLAAYRTADVWKRFLNIEEFDATGISGVTTGNDSEAEAIYGPDGRRVDAPQKGINLIRMSDGTTRKVYVK